MTRKRRFKVQLGFAAFVIIIVIYGWSEYDLSDKMTRNAVSRTKEISDGSFTRRTLLAYSTLENKTCTRPSIAEFPGDLFNQSQRKHGAVVFHFFVAFYLSWAIAIVSDDYFVPVMEIICEKLKLQSDVAGATFMAFGSSAPELFASIIGVFITQGDIGVGTILGSAVFNVLFVIGACGVGAGTVLYLSWWPFVRDNMFYFFSLVILILVLMDGIVTWPEALAMVLSFSFYLLIMFFNPRIEAWLYRITNTSNPEFKSDLDALNRNENSKTINTTFSYEKMVDEKNYRIQEKEKKSDGTENNRNAEKETDEDKADGKEREEKNDKQKEETQPLNGSGSHVSRHYDSIPQQQPDPDFAPKTPFSPPKGLLSRLSWLFALPIKVAFYLTIPDVKKESCQKWVAFSFVICILWVAVASYALVWMVTVIGYTFGLSDAIMGLTLVAFGSSVSDCAASVFIARKGDGNMAVSNTIGSNTFDILLCLGVPWLVKSLWNHQSPIVIHSHGLFLSCFCILGSVVIAFLVLFFTKWVLNRKVGCIFLMAYFIFLGSSIYMELRHSDLLPTCAIKV